MLTVNQRIEREAHRQVRRRVRMSVQPGALNAIMAQEISTAIADALSDQLAAERDQALGRRPYERLPQSPARNGFKLLSLPGFLGRMTLRRPVLRKGTLHSPLLHALRSAGQGLSDFLAVRFWLRGASTRAVADEIRSATGAKISRSTVSALSNALEPVLRQWESRPIPHDIRYLFLDALYLPIRRPGFTRKQALLTAIGVDSRDQRHVLGFLLGDRESHDAWQALIDNLLQRGLQQRNLRLVVSDEHKSIESAVAQRLALPHQLCVVHLLHNLKPRVARPDWKDFLADLHNVFWADDRDQALQAHGSLQQRWQRRYPTATALLARRFDDHIRFFQEPRRLWTLLRSTNLIERFNEELRRRLKPAGTMHSELELKKLVWAVSQAQEKRWAGRAWKPRGVLKRKEPVSA